MIYKNYAHLTLPAAYRERIAERAENTRRFVVPLVQVTLDDVIGDRFTLHLEEPATPATQGRRSSAIRTLLKQLEITRAPLLAFESNVVTPEEARPYLLP